MGNLPDEVRIGHYRWRVVVDDALEIWGKTEHETLTLTVKGGLPELHSTCTLLHEICHAALAASGINDHDELHVNALSMRLVEILRDNPDLVRVLVEGANGGKA